MKTGIYFYLGALLILPSSAFAQGEVRNVNNITGILRALVYGIDPGNPTVVKVGQSPQDIPAGTVIYGGAPLAGTGFTVQLWGIGGRVTDPGPLLPAINGTSTFRTGAAAGIWTETL